MSASEGTVFCKPKLAASFVAALAFVLSSDAVADDTARFDQQGLSISLSMQRTGTSTVSINATATETEGGRPFRNLNMAGWVIRGTTQPLSTELCKNRIRSFLQGGLATAADASLNAYRLISLNDDNTVTFINPAVSLGGSKLESLVELPSAGRDMLLDATRRNLFVTLPDADVIAVIDVLTHQVTRKIAVPRGSQPSRLFSDQGGSHLWVTLEGEGKIALLPPTEGDALQVINVGQGPINMALDTDRSKLFVTSAKAGKVTEIDPSTFKTVVQFEAGVTPVSAAYGKAAQLLYVANLNSEFVTVVDPSDASSGRKIPVGRGVSTIGFERDGRFAFLLNTVTSQIMVLDTATERIIAKASAEVGEPDQIVFSDRFAYVHFMNSSDVLVYSLDQAKKGTLSPVRIQIGTRKPAEVVDALYGQVITLAPDGSSAFIANPAEEEIFYYAEGMMVPMGTVENHGRHSRALLLLNQGLEEVSPGVYLADISLRGGSEFDVPIITSAPAFSHCFHLSLPLGEDEASGEAAASLSFSRVTSDEAPLRPTANVPFNLGIRIVDGRTGELQPDLKAVVMLVHGIGSNYFRRLRLRNEGGGLYGARVRIPASGSYELLFSVPPIRVSFERVGSLKLDVTEARRNEAAR
jgi:DNA-binding beta-propeller fold protein YncE